MTVDIHCVTKWSKLDTVWQGVSIDTLLDGIETSAEYVVQIADGGYTTNLPLEDVTDGKAWVAFGYDGEPLEPEHSGPARMLVPHLYFWKSAKWVRGLRLQSTDEPGFWEINGYNNYGDEEQPGMIAGMQSVYEAAGSDEGPIRLAEAWHSRVMADDVVSHAFSHGFHTQHSERLAAYWAEALGGPSTYSERYGDETSVVRIHSGNGPHEEMDQRAVACFDQALEDGGLTAEPLRQVLHDYFAWATTTTMSAYHDSVDAVPQGLSIPRWSWDGLQH